VPEEQRDRKANVPSALAGDVGRGEARGDRVGPYVLLELIDDEGIGAMWLAQRPEPPNERVVLVIADGGADPQAVLARFEVHRLAMEAAGLPGLCRALGSGVTPGGKVYFVLEHADGEMMVRYADRECLTVYQRVDDFIEVCETLEHARKLGIIHGDLRPHCIRVVEINGVPRTKVVGVGLVQAMGHMPGFRARFLDSGRLGAAIEHFSPEGASGDAPIDPRTDIHALGLLLYELFYGLLPVDARTLRSVGYSAICEYLKRQRVQPPTERLLCQEKELWSEIADQRHTEVGDLLDWLRGSLDWICLKALQAAPEMRYASPGELAEEVRRNCRGQPTDAGPETDRSAETKEEAVRRLSADAALLAVRREMYAAKVIAADALFATGEPKRGREMLDSCPEDLRAWEWRWLASRMDCSLVALSGHQKRVNRVAFDHAGERVVTASEDRSARVWDVRSGRGLAVLRGHRDGVCWAAFDPSGARVVTASHDRTAVVWDASTGNVLAALVGHEGPLVFAEFSPKGDRIFTSSRDRTARLWDAASGVQIAVMGAHKNVVVSAAFSRNGDRIVTGSQDKTARVWDGTTGSQLAVMVGHTRAVEWVALSPTGDRVVTASSDQTARIWDLATGSQLVELKGHESVLTCAAFSPDGTRVATASCDASAVIWDALTGNIVARLRGHEKAVKTVEFSRSGDRVVTASHDKTVRIWDAASGQPVVVLRGHQAPVDSAGFSPSGDRIVSMAGVDTPRVWDGAQDLRPTVLNAGSKVISAAFSPSGDRIVTSCEDRVARVWDSDTGTLLASLRGHTDSLVSARFDGNGTRIVTASGDRTARVWDARTGMPISVLRGHEDQIGTAAISPGGDWVVTGSCDGSARVFDANTGDELAVFTARERSRMSPFGVKVRLGNAGTWREAAALDGKFSSAAVLGTTGGRLVSPMGLGARVWDAVSGRVICTMKGHTDTVVGAEFSRSGDRVVTASYDGTARVWDATTGAQIACLTGHAWRVEDASFSPSGDRVVTASRDCTARVWDANTGTELAILKGHEREVWSARFDPRGDRIVTGSEDGTARVWHALSYRELFPAICRARDACATVGPLVRRRLSAGEMPEAILAAIVGDDSLGDMERRFAAAEVERAQTEVREAVAKARVEADELNEAAWKLVSAAPVTADAARRAIELARKALALVPGRGYYMNTLGIALYRGAVHESGLREALEVLTRSAEINAKGKGGAVPADFVFIAMAQWRLGHRSEAMTAAARFRELAESARWRGTSAIGAWAEELAATMGGAG